MTIIRLLTFFLLKYLTHYCCKCKADSESMFTAVSVATNAKIATNILKTIRSTTLLQCSSLCALTTGCVTYSVVAASLPVSTSTLSHYFTCYLSSVDPFWLRSEIFSLRGSKTYSGRSFSDYAYGYPLSLHY